MYKQVIIVRADIKMSKGKTAAQVAHASVSALDRANKKIAGEWKRSGQKKVVLKVAGLKELKKIKDECDSSGVPAVLVADAGLTEVEPGTITALAIGPEDEKKIDRITGKLKML